MAQAQEGYNLEELTEAWKCGSRFSCLLQLQAKWKACCKKSFVNPVLVLLYQ